MWDVHPGAVLWASHASSRSLRCFGPHITPCDAYSPSRRPQLPPCRFLRSIGLNGTLPASWGAPGHGMNKLRELWVDGNDLSGVARRPGCRASKADRRGCSRVVAPPSCQASAACQASRGTRLDAPTHVGPPARLPAPSAGTIPAEWSALTSLEMLYVKPGNARLCGPLPPNLPFKVRPAWRDAAVPPALRPPALPPPGMPHAPAPSVCALIGLPCCAVAGLAPPFPRRSAMHLGMSSAIRRPPWTAPPARPGTRPLRPARTPAAARQAQLWGA